MDDTIVLKRPRRGARLREEIWQTEDGNVTKYNPAYITGTSWAGWNPSRLTAKPRLRSGFMTKFTICGRWKAGKAGGNRMNKTVKTVRAWYDRGSLV